jgi:RNA recognition motif-containing protein
MEEAIKEEKPEEQEDLVVMGRKRQRQEENGVDSNSPCRSRYSRMKKKAKTDETASTISFYIGNIHRRTDEGDLHHFLASHGVSGHSVRLAYDLQGRRRSYGFVEVSSARDVVTMQTLDAARFCGRPLRVELAHRSSQTVWPYNNGRSSREQWTRSVWFE